MCPFQKALPAKRVEGTRENLLAFAFALACAYFDKEYARIGARHLGPPVYANLPFFANGIGKENEQPKPQSKGMKLRGGRHKRDILGNAGGDVGGWDHPIDSS
ncbi:hypothetical protein GPALN_014399 [Globodera pallida]|nr:hypothetical protein GPALN_014399 [Globodera pallida]